MARLRIPIVITAAVLAVTGLTGTATAEERSTAQPPATDCGVIDFESAQVRTLPTIPPQHAGQSRSVGLHPAARILGN